MKAQRVVITARARVMRTYTPGFLLLLLASGCQPLHDPRLIGRFESDKEATIEYLRSTGTYTPAKLEILEPLFGKMKLTYGQNTVVSELDGKTETNAFSVLKVTPKDAIVETTVRFLDKPAKYRLTFTDDGYWLSEGPLAKGFKEKFRRIATKTSEPSVAPAP